MSLRIDTDCEPIPGYRLIERIGMGGFGEVWKAEAPGGLLKAIKVIHGDLRSVDVDGAKHAEQELRALKRLQGIRHPYLLSLERYDVVQGRVLIVSELADCNLWDRFREHRANQRPGIPRGELMRYMQEAAEVLDLMNNQYQLQHLDVKPQNLFLLHNHVKVADFGLVKDLEGLRGQITGGVTPVYAAPETFDGVITRYCDQYSFAIVYQELLTGVRPFDGTSGQKLLLQHLREPPNLGPLPPADRPIIGRALSKKPEDRYPTCMEMVDALTNAGTDAPQPRGPIHMSSPRVDTPVGMGRTIPPLPPVNPGQRAEPLPPMETPKTQLNLRRDESASALAYSFADVQLPHKIAPPEMAGDGTLVPAVLIGLGQSGLEIIRDFKRSIRERFGGPERLPHLRLLYVDTDSAALHTATESAGMTAEEVIPTRLNRAAHYLKPRRSGRSLVEGWFDPQTLYRIPRNPATVGIRALGRLAFLDHYRTFTEKLVGAIEGCTHPDALNAADRATKLGPRSNRPRVYVVAGLAGGTGGGMFLDVAYTARHKLRQMGYLDPEVIGVLVTPPAERAVKGPALANTYAALRELHHFAQPDTTFSAHYEERDGRVNDPAPPFSRCFVVPAAPTPKAGEPLREGAARRAATFLLGDLLSPIGRAADDARWQKSDFGPADVAVSVFGQAAFVWPRQVLLTRTARWLSASVLTRWTSSDPDVIGRYVKGWLGQRWQMEQLGADHLVGRMQKCGEAILGQPPEAVFAAEAQPFVQKGWFAKEPEPAKLWQTLAKLQNIVGMPDERSLQRTIGNLEQALDTAADGVAREYGPKFARLATTLLEHPDYRLVGAEEAIKQAQGLIDGILAQYEPTSTNLGFQAIDAFHTIQQYLNADKAQRRPDGKTVAEAVKAYPTWRYQSIVLRQVCRIYRTIRTQLGDQLRDLQFCRQRLEEVTAGIQRDQSDAVPPPERTLLPAGVPSLDAAVDALQEGITADDLRSFDKKLQVQIEQEFNALFNVCQSSVNMLGNLQSTIQEQARAFLAPRLGAASLDQMFMARYPDTATAAKALGWLFDQAEPPIKVFGPDRQETVVLAGPTGDEFRKLADYALSGPPTDCVSSPDEVIVYREFAHVPLTTLPQLGPLAEDAYNAALDAQGGPHCRIDVGAWQDVEVG